MILRRRVRICLVIVTFTALIGPASAWAQFGPGRPKARLSLHSSVEAVAPGQPFEVGIRFALEKGWHIYWVNSGESGMAPVVTWDIPDGFAAGDLRFPVPKRHVTPPNITTNVLCGEPMLLVPLTPPGSIPDRSITIQAKVDYLICKTKCIRESAELKLDMDVSPEAEVNEKAAVLFEQARRVLPKATAKHVTLTPEVHASALTPNQAFEFTLTVDVVEGHRIVMHEPSVKDVAGCELFIEPTAGVWFDDAVYPKSRVRTVSDLGDVGMYSGRFVISVPAEVDEKPSSDRVRFAGVLAYQLVTADGTAVAPSAVSFELLADETSTGTGSVARAALDGTGGGQGNESGGFFADLGLLGRLVACFLYGLFINATPCVLPVLSIKVLGFVQQAHESRRRTLVLGLAFGAGVLLFFVILGLLAAGGTNILQFPAAVISLGAIVMALALSMLGVYTLGAPSAAANLEARIRQEGLFASFGKGSLAPVLGFACTGPLLAGAWGWAVQQPSHVAVLAFLFAGLGMASPYVVLGANPNWLSFLPKPGPWMVTFERIMGFLLLAMVIWLIHPLVKQIGPAGLEWTLIFYVAIAFGCWLLGKVDYGAPAPARWRYRGGAIALIAVAGLFIYGWAHPLGQAEARQHELRLRSHAGHVDGSKDIPWRPWSEEAVRETVVSGKTVFVDFTADYCPKCRSNKALAVNTPEVRAKMKALGIVPFQADFTSRDPAIAEGLRKHSRASLPLNLIYPAAKPDEPIILRTKLTTGYLLEKLDEAGPSQSARAD